MELSIEERDSDHRQKAFQFFPQTGRRAQMFMTGQ